MNVLHVQLDRLDCTFRAADHVLTTPLGTDAVGRNLHGDPPRADELTNAIGEVHDTLDDVLRARPPTSPPLEALEVCGPGTSAVADVEVGAPATLPLGLSRDAAEDVFRTVATERRVDRARNPGLAADDVDVVVAAGCVLVAVMRRLRLDHVQVVDPPVDPGRPAEAGESAAPR